MQLFQTPQLSDEIDKVVDVWNDVFFDSQDLHGYFPRQNLYGPVSFKFSIDLILNPEYFLCRQVFRPDTSLIHNTRNPKNRIN